VLRRGKVEMRRDEKKKNLRMRKLGGRREEMRRGKK
jgi:hypothetical protein